MFGRVPTLPIAVIMGLPSADVATTAQEYTQKTAEIYVMRMSLQGNVLAKEPRPKQRLTKQSNSMSSKKGDLVLVHSPHAAEDDENVKFVSPWRGPYCVRSQLPTVVYRVEKPGDTTETLCTLGG